MPRAHRHFLPNHVWHITHRCHKRDFLLKFERDRRRWRFWLFQAKKRYGLCVLNYIATSNHIHLLVLDKGVGEISKSMQLIAGRTAQEYNHRKGRKGAFWEDRYHATAVDTEGYLARCMTYIDLNMVRTGIIKHPDGWSVSGYREIQNPPDRYATIDVPALIGLLNMTDLVELQKASRDWIDERINSSNNKRESVWSESLAVGRIGFLARIKSDLGIRALHRKVSEHGGQYRLKETSGRYSDIFGEKRGL